MILHYTGTLPTRHATAMEPRFGRRQFSIAPPTSIIVFQVYFVGSA